MKTIFITISRGGTARNILQSDCFKVLKDSGNRLVIITPAWKDPDFTELFKAPNVVFEEMVEPEWSFADRLLVGLHKGLVYNRSTVFRDKYGIYNPDEGSLIKFWIRRLFVSPFARIKSLKDLTRVLDRLFARASHYKELFDRYNPDVLFATSMIEDNDVALMKRAQEAGVPIVAMPKTWDNASKINLRVKVDKVLVWGEYSKEEVMKYSNISSDKIEIIGIPQFDFYVDDSIVESREKFFEKLGLDPLKKLIVFGSEGRVTPGDKDVAHMLVDWMNKGVFQDVQLLIRPHFMYPEDEKKFEGIPDNPKVVIDSGWVRSGSFRDNWDYSARQIKRFSNIIKHADLMITSASTLSVDACSVDCPVINIYFDGYIRKPFKYSIRRWYTSEHYSHVIESGAVSLAHDPTDLMELITMYLKDNRIRSKERHALIKYFGFLMDGKSGIRVASSILSMIGQIYEPTRKSTFEHVESSHKSERVVA